MSEHKTPEYRRGYQAGYKAAKTGSQPSVEIVADGKLKRARARRDYWKDKYEALAKMLYNFPFLAENYGKYQKCRDTEHENFRLKRLVESLERENKRLVRQVNNLKKVN